MSDAGDELRPPPPPPAAAPIGYWQASDGNWYPPQTPPPAYTPWQGIAQPEKPRTNAMATASLVLGVVGLCAFWAMGVGVVLGVLAVIFGAVGWRNDRADRTDMLDRKERANRQAKAGVILGIAAILLGSAFFVGMILVSDDIDTDPSDGRCNNDRYWQDPDC